MANPYYTFTPRFVPGTKVRAGAVNAQYDALVVAFDQLPAVSSALPRGIATLGTESGSGNTFVVTMPNTRLTNQEGDEIVFRATHTNTGVSTLTVDAIPAVTLRRYDGTALNSGDIVTNQFYAARYDAAGIRFLIVYPTLQTNVGVLTYAAPTATVGLAAIGGSATTVMRSDAAPAINLTISPTWSGVHTFTTPIAVASGGTALSAGISGGVLGYTAAGVLASSVALTANQLVLGGGAGATPTPLGSLGTTTTVLHGNAAGAPTFGSVVLTSDVSSVLPVANGGVGLSAGTSGGVLGYTAAGVLASSVALTVNQLVLGGGAGATPTPLGSLGTTTTLLHGNAAGAPTFGAVVLTADVSGILPVANGGTGSNTAGGALTNLGAVPTTRTLTAGAGLTGGGDLSADRTFDVGAGTGITVNANDVALDTASTRNTDHAAVSISGGTSLTGGGDITANRTLTLVNDEASPGNSEYYGTNSGGTKGFFPLPISTAIKVAAGRVTAAGALEANSINVTSVSHPGTGSYGIDFTAAGFSTIPSFVVSFSVIGNSQNQVNGQVTSTTAASVDARDDTGTLVDRAFNFIAIGT